MTLSAIYNQEGHPEPQKFEVTSFSLKSGRTCPRVRLGFCVFAEHPDLPVIVLHPALTGSPKAWSPGKSSQGDGWFTRNIGPGKFLDTSKFCVVCVDPLGGNGYSSSAEELSDFSSALSFADGISLTAHVLRKLGISSLHAVIGGSIGGGQALEWLFQNEIKVERVFDISGSACRTNTAVEFFKLQADILAGDMSILAGVKERLLKNCSDLKGSTEAFDYILNKVLLNLSALESDYKQIQAIKVARQIGFLRFVTPTFYQTRLDLYREESDNDGQAKSKLISWLEYQGETFSQRFSPLALRQLCLMDANATFRSPDIIAEALALKNIKLIGFSVEGDTLFPEHVQKSYYDLVSECLPFDSKNLVQFVSIKDELNGHDHFLTEGFVKSAKNLSIYLE